jgi:dethiobiotin synthetase
MQRFFITSSGTAIGKTLVTALLAAQAQQHGRSVKALKPVISGVDWQDPQAIEVSDSGVLAQAQGLTPTAEVCAALSPFRFHAPLAPLMAASREGTSLQLSEIMTFCRKAEVEAPDLLLVEGVGGVMVPLNSTHTVLDWMVALGYPVILVVGSYLGALSHTLTAYQTLCHAGVTVAGVIISESSEPAASLDETASSLQHFIHAPLLTLPYIHHAHPWQHAPDLYTRLEQP